MSFYRCGRYKNSSLEMIENPIFVARFNFLKFAEEKPFNTLVFFLFSVS